MKNTAYFINVGRGKVCKVDDLADAIESGQIAGCGLDVFDEEPLPSEHKLWGLQNVLLTPHVAVRDAGNIPERRYQVLIDNARRFLVQNPRVAETIEARLREALGLVARRAGGGGHLAGAHLDRRSRLVAIRSA